MEYLSEYISQIKVPSAHDNIYSEECVFSYDTPVNLCKLFLFTPFDFSYLYRNQRQDSLLV